MNDNNRQVTSFRALQEHDYLSLLLLSGHPISVEGRCPVRSEVLNYFERSKPIFRFYLTAFICLCLMHSGAFSETFFLSLIIKQHF